MIGRRIANEFFQDLQDLVLGTSETHEPQEHSRNPVSLYVLSTTHTVIKNITDLVISHVSR